MKNNHKTTATRYHNWWATICYNTTTANAVSFSCSMKQDGTLIGYRDYEPFGAPLSAKQEKTRLGFIDKEQDKESSLADHGVRKYDYETGRKPAQRIIA